MALFSFPYVTCSVAPVGPVIPVQVTISTERTPFPQPPSPQPQQQSLQSRQIRLKFFNIKTSSFEFIFEITLIVKIACVARLNASCKLVIIICLFGVA